MHEVNICDWKLFIGFFKAAIDRTKDVGFGLGIFSPCHSLAYFHFIFPSIKMIWNFSFWNRTEPSSITYWLPIHTMMQWWSKYKVYENWTQGAQGKLSKRRGHRPLLLNKKRKASHVSMKNMGLSHNCNETTLLGGQNSACLELYSKMCSKFAKPCYSRKCPGIWNTSNRVWTRSTSL